VPMRSLASAEPRDASASVDQTTRPSSQVGLWDRRKGLPAGVLHVGGQQLTQPPRLADPQLRGAEGLWAVDAGGGTEVGRAVVQRVGAIEPHEVGGVDPGMARC